MNFAYLVLTILLLLFINFQAYKCDSNEINSAKPLKTLWNTFLPIQRLLKKWSRKLNKIGHWKQFQTEKSKINGSTFPKNISSEIFTILHTNDAGSGISPNLNIKNMSNTADLIPQIKQSRKIPVKNGLTTTLATIINSSKIDSESYHSNYSFTDKIDLTTFQTTTNEALLNRTTRSKSELSTSQFELSTISAAAKNSLKVRFMGETTPRIITHPKKNLIDAINNNILETVKSLNSTMTNQKESITILVNIRPENGTSVLKFIDLSNVTEV